MSAALILPYVIAFVFQWGFAGVDVPNGKGDGGSARYDYVTQKQDCVQGPALQVPDGKQGLTYFCQVR